MKVEELLDRWPRNVPERLDRALSVLGGNFVAMGEAIKLPFDDPGLLLCENPAEAWFVVSSLEEMGYLAGENTRQGFHGKISHVGWAQIAALSRKAPSSDNPVFVAMWFGWKDRVDDMNRLYADGIRAAVESAGYRAVRVDLVEHNGWIMDEVMAGIRIAPFVVADFTGHRNGAYFEAGFARGLGIPVIHTCEACSLEQAHFDTRQLNHVTWSTAEEMRVRLYNRIMGSIGPGPFRKPVE
jgi:hypothetical protein